MTIECTYRVMYFDTDAAGVVHNLAYLRMIETVRTELALKMGMSFEVIERTGIHPVLTRTEIDYRRPGKLGDVLAIRGKIADWSAARFWVEFEMFSGETLLATCRQCLALVKVPEGKVVKLPEGFPNTLHA